MQEKVILRAVLLACTISTHAAEPEYTIAARARNGFRLEVSVRVNGAGPFWCTLDSGAGGGGFVLDLVSAKKAGLRTTSGGQSFGEGPGVVTDARVLNATLELDNLHIPHQTAVVRPLDEGCIIGTVLFDHFVVEIDYLAPAIRLHNANGYQPAVDAIGVPLMRDPYGRPMIIGRLFLQSRDAVNARLLLDTAIADYSLSLSKAFTDSHSLLRRVSKVIQPPFKAQGTGGGIDILATRIVRLSVGAASVSNPIVMLFRTRSGAAGQQPDGLIGSGYLHRFLVAIDASNGRLYLTPNRTYRDAEPTWPWAVDLPLVQ